MSHQEPTPAARDSQPAEVGRGGAVHAFAAGAGLGANSLMAIGSAAVIGVYAAGYFKTRAAADRFAADADVRRPPPPSERAASVERTVERVTPPTADPHGTRLRAGATAAMPPLPAMARARETTTIKTTTTPATTEPVAFQATVANAVPSATTPAPAHVAAPASATDGGHHIVDPRMAAASGARGLTTSSAISVASGFTAVSATAVASATVIAPSAMVADAFATAALVMGAVAGIDFLEQNGVNGVLFTPTLERFATKGFNVETPESNGAAARRA